MLGIEETVVESGADLTVTAPKSIGGYASGKARLELYRPSGEHVKSIPNIEDENLRFPLLSVSPGIYTADVAVSGTSLRLVDMVLVAVPDLDKRIAEFQRALSSRVTANELSPSERTAVLKEVQKTYESLGLRDLAAEVAREVGGARPFESTVRPLQEQWQSYREGTIKIRLYRSPISCPEKHKRVVLGLGLRKLNRIVQRPDTPVFRGMVKKVPHLLQIVE